MNVVSSINNKMTQHRWVICALLFFATSLNYLDRSVIGLLKETLTLEFHWTENDYGNIVICFQVAYAIALLTVGWVIDKIGTRMGYALSITIWSIASALHGFASGTLGFAAARALLGVGEAGNFPAANKVIAEWFPKKDRAFATGIFNSGANIGAIVAPLVIPWMAINWGWQWAFIATGIVGFIWLIFWFWQYGDPHTHEKVSKAELEYISSDQNTDEADIVETEETKSRISYWKLLTYRQTWAFSFGKFFTDPVWWFFLFWLPAFLEVQYGLSGMQVSVPLIVVYTLSSIGSISGGWLPKFFASKGRKVTKARKMAMLIYAFVPLLVLFTQKAGGYSMWLAVIIIGLACAAHCAWSANMYATVSDMFPKKAIGAITGIGSMAGAVGGVLIAKAAGLLFDYYKEKGDITEGYGIMFLICSVMYLVAWVAMQTLAPNFRSIEEENKK